MSTAVAQLSTWRTLPFAQLRKNRYFYMYYDAAYAFGAAVAIGAMLAVGHYGLYGEGNLLGAFQWWHLAFFPLITYCIILCHVFAHVCTHQSLPKPWNRIVGEVCGLVVLTRFASWEVVHQRHHRYSDNTEKDPHPCLPSYLRHFWLTISNVERQLQQTYFDLYGDTPENHAYEKRRAYVSYATNILVISAFFLFLGPTAFFVFFGPASILAAFHLVHFNWSTHNAQSATADYHPVNLNHGYFKLGNKLFFGIYMHANHHKWPNVLNPAHAKVQLPIEPAPTAATEAARAHLKKTWDYSARPAVAE